MYNIFYNIFATLKNDILWENSFDIHCICSIRDTHFKKYMKIMDSNRFQKLIRNLNQKNIRVGNKRAQT